MLAYVTPEEDTKKKDGSPSTKSRHGRHNALQPEVRLIDIASKEEIDSDTLEVSRYQTLSSSDYHMSVLPPTRVPVAASTQRGALEAIGTGMWDAALYPARMFSGAASIRGAGASIRSGGSAEKNSISIREPNAEATSIRTGATNSTTRKSEAHVAFATEPIRIYIHSPYDCILALKRDLADRLSWLDSHGKYQQAWELIDEHPEAVGSVADQASSEASSTPTRSQASLEEFFADGQSESDTPAIRRVNSVVEKEKRRIGESWLQQLVDAGDWAEAGQVAGRVLNTSSRWEYWIWLFVRNKKVDDITPYIPTESLRPPLPSVVYEVILGHYVNRDTQRFRDLLDTWSPTLFEINSITTAITNRIKNDKIPDGTKEWTDLTECLAKLHLADGHYREALRCYIRLQDANAAMSLIRDYHLLDAVADDIPGLVLLRVTKQQSKSAPISELEAVSSEAIQLLVSEAHHGIVQPDTVVSQLQDANLPLYLFFYLRSLWRGDGAQISPQKGKSRQRATDLAAAEGRALLEPFADTVLTLFAEYDRPLLMDFLHTSTSYSYTHASNVCQSRRYISELVYILSKTGQTKDALFLIIDELNDESQAISFAKTQDDPDLWNDLLDYSMDKPSFIRGLLMEVGTAIDPLTLVKRIPSGLEIPGLREGLARMIREFDLQNSISEGAARVLQGEVAIGLNTLRGGQRRGIKFDIFPHEPYDAEQKPQKAPGKCTECKENFGLEDGMQYPDAAPQETLVGFACGHIYHVSCLLKDAADDENLASLLGRQASSDEDDGFIRSVGPKVDRARLIRDRVSSGCPVCTARDDT